MLQNEAFLAALRRTGHPRLAAQLLGVHRAKAAQWETAGDCTLEEGEETAPPLPALDQVTGWSKADPDPVKATHNPDLALFGGWRLKDWEKRKKATGG